jgi:chorismate dehydratase
VLSRPETVAGGSSASGSLKTYDLAGLWREHTGLGFVFAMWMTRHARVAIDLAAARDEGLQHLAEIAANYSTEIGLSSDEMHEYLSSNISYSIDASMQSGMELYFKLAASNGLIPHQKDLRFI